MKFILHNGKVWYIYNKLKQNLDILISDVIASNMDFVLVIDGEEGSGKSFGARGIGAYIKTVLKNHNIDVPFNADNIHFNIEDYIQGSVKGGMYHINILDEGREALGRNKARSKTVERFVDYMSECRYKKQFHIILIPSYHDLHSYIAQWRARAVIHFTKGYVKDESTLSGYKIQYGEFKLYCHREGLRFNHRMRTYKYPNTYEAWSRFTNKEAFSDEELAAYEAKKISNVEAKFLGKNGNSEKPKKATGGEPYKYDLNVVEVR